MTGVLLATRGGAPAITSRWSRCYCHAPWCYERTIVRRLWSS